MPVGRWCTHTSRKWKRKVDLNNMDYSCPVDKNLKTVVTEAKENGLDEMSVCTGFGLG